MAQEPAPAFPFYVQDFLLDMSSAQMSYEARGIFVTLLCFAWREGSLPSEAAALAALLHLTLAQFERVWPQLAGCFVENADHRLVNPRLERERIQQRRREQHRHAIQRARALSGRAGGLARWKKVVALGLTLGSGFLA